MNWVLPRNPKYGWIPDLPDKRDLSYGLLFPKIEKLPTTVDLRKYCTQVEDQGKLGSCTACALVGNLEFLKKKTIKKVIDFSELFLYFNERVITHTEKTDGGASLRDGIKTLVKTGDCTEDLWPYVIKKFSVKPPTEAYENAQRYQITRYFRLHTLDEMKQTLSEGNPFVFGFAVYESFESKMVRKTGIVHLPTKDERMVGGHAVCAVGYDETKDYFIVRNSWGENWGDKGYFYMPFKYLSDRSLSADFWTIRDME